MACLAEPTIKVVLGRVEEGDNVHKQVLVVIPRDETVEVSVLILPIRNIAVVINFLEMSTECEPFNLQQNLKIVLRNLNVFKKLVMTLLGNHYIEQRRTITITQKNSDLKSLV